MMETWVIAVLLLCLFSLSAILIPSLGKAVWRYLKAGFYLLVLVAVVGWTVLTGLVGMGLRRLTGR